MSKFEYFDADTVVEHVSIADLPALLAQPSSQQPYPIARYARTLKELRQQSAKIGNEQQQMEFGVLVRDSLAALADELGLPAGHFSVDTSGDPLLVKEGTGQHWIMPTNFEGGAYFSAPHADHQYGLEAEQVPRINIGQYARFGKGSGINAGGDITIGNAAWLSPGSLLLRQDHAAYGRPSIGSRTVSMTRQPGVVMRDYAWVGRDALVGWNSDYLGLGSIVGTRSFINGWVGDYSIVGDHDRILQYQPFKAFLFDRYDLSVPEVMRISDWHKVNQDWLKVYARELDAVRGPEDHSAFTDSVQGTVGRGSRALLIAPRSLHFLPPLAEAKVDVITRSTALTPFLLQWAGDHRNRNLRVRSDLKAATLPFDTAGSHHYNRQVGYQVVISEYDNDNPPISLTELERVTAKGGIVLAEDRTLVDDRERPDNMIDNGQLAVEETTFTVFTKK